MAARLNPAPSRPPEIVDLRRLNARDLEPLLQEETAAWWETLEWDFEKSADLVRRFVDLRALNGYALVDDGMAVGYVYYVLEDAKGLLGDLYVMREHRTIERENVLLSAALDAIIAHTQVTRVESQLMMLDFSIARSIPGSDTLRTFDRNFMWIDLRRAELAEVHPRRAVTIDRWTDLLQEATAHLIAAAYRGHVDSSINDQYRTTPGARRFLHNIVQYPGCGSFFRPASFAAFEPARGALCGISLASLVSQECGHITQICVSPEVKGSGVGYALLRQSLAALRDVGCRAATLTVTAANEGAVDLYKRVGFETIRRFSAYVWEGFRG
ncbi:MAG TPA: GNAT family N-acetyltransferase [Bryobacteraceae bacterium]|nr:GNAT family N-acetyltransferase [Bryobacteraceae bacterium]